MFKRKSSRSDAAMSSLVGLGVAATLAIGSVSAASAKTITIRIGSGHPPTVVYAGLMMGGLGTAAGAVFGFVVSWLLNKYRLVTLPGDVYFIKNLPVEMQIQDFVVVCVAAILITLLATIYPAYRAARMEPVEAIRYE